MEQHTITVLNIAECIANKLMQNNICYYEDLIPSISADSVSVKLFVQHSTNSMSPIVIECNAMGKLRVLTDKYTNKLLNIL